MSIPKTKRASKKLNLGKILILFHTLLQVTLPSGYLISCIFGPVVGEKYNHTNNLIWRSVQIPGIGCEIKGHNILTLQ